MKEYDETMKANILRLHSQGLTTRKVAAELGISASGVSRNLVKLRQSGVLVESEPYERRGSSRRRAEASPKPDSASPVAQPVDPASEAGESSAGVQANQRSQRPSRRAASLGEQNHGSPSDDGIHSQVTENAKESVKENGKEDAINTDAKAAAAQPRKREPPVRANTGGSARRRRRRESTSTDTSDESDDSQSEEENGNSGSDAIERNINNNNGRAGNNSGSADNKTGSAGNNNNSTDNNNRRADNSNGSADDNIGSNADCAESGPGKENEVGPSKAVSKHSPDNTVDKRKGRVCKKGRLCWAGWLVSPPADSATGGGTLDRHPQLIYRCQYMRGQVSSVPLKDQVPAVNGNSDVNPGDEGNAQVSVLSDQPVVSNQAVPLDEPAMSNQPLAS